MDQCFINALLSYRWRGNVRELEHAVEHALIMLGGSSTLQVDHLPEKIQDAYQNSLAEGVIHDTWEECKDKLSLLAFAEQKMIERVLASVNGNVSVAAEQLGINRRTIYRKLQRKESDRLS